MITAGIDIGSVSTEVVIVDNNKAIIDSIVIASQVDIEKTANEALDIVLKNSNINRDDIDSIVATGYGRNNVPFANKSVTEITCHAMGAHHLFPGTKTIIDIGGQDSKAIAITSRNSGSPRVVDFIMNDKCAAGTGRFLEVMAGVLNVDTKDLGALSEKSIKEVSISSMCTVFAESEVISLIHQKLSTEDIISGLHTAIVRKVLSLVQRIPMENEITLTGGVMKNLGMCKKLKEELSQNIVNLPDDPQIAGALGAAIIARKYVS